MLNEQLYYHDFSSYFYDSIEGIVSFIFDIPSVIPTEPLSYCYHIIEVLTKMEFDEDFISNLLLSVAQAVLFLFYNSFIV